MYLVNKGNVRPAGSVQELQTGAQGSQGKRGISFDKVQTPWSAQRPAGQPPIKGIPSMANANLPVNISLTTKTATAECQMRRKNPANPTISPLQPSDTSGLNPVGLPGGKRQLDANLSSCGRAAIEISLNHSCDNTSQPCARSSGCELYHKSLSRRLAERSFWCRGRPGRRLREASATSYAPDRWVNRRGRRRSSR